MSWQRATTWDALAAGPVVFHQSPLQIVLYRVEDQVFAIDNRCPHEGYPLAEGTLDEQCQLTCNWHNWKFRLSDGVCVLGGDHVRVYDVKIEAGDVWIDLSSPDPQVQQAGILNGFQTAFRKRDTGRICRELTRLEFHRLDPQEALRSAIAWSHDRLEFGTSHAYAATADWLTLADRYTDDWERRLICLAEAVDHIAHDALRRPRYPYATVSAAFSTGAFQEAVEKEDSVTAEGLVHRALAEGLHFDNLEPDFTRAALQHYNDFGHSLIYVQKTGELIARLGAECEAWLLPALTRHLCYTTREDLIPEFKGITAALAALPARAGEQATPPSLSGLQKGGVRGALSWVTTHLQTHGIPVLFDALLQANARNQVGFDTSYQESFDRPVNDSVGWLSFTHALTFSQAVAAQCGKFTQQWPRGLLQMACFVGRNQRFLDSQIELAAWQVTDATAYLAQVREGLLDHGMRDPIISAHLLKTTMAVERLVSDCQPDTAVWLLAALRRFLESPFKQKHIRRLARQAIDLVGRDFPGPTGMA